MARPTTTVAADTAVTLLPAVTPRSPTGAAARSEESGDRFGMADLFAVNSEDNLLGSVRQSNLQV